MEWDEMVYSKVFDHVSNIGPRHHQGGKSKDTSLW